MHELTRSSLFFAAALTSTGCGLPPGCLPGYQPPVHTAKHELQLEGRSIELSASTFSYFVSGGRGAWGHRVYGFEARLRVGDRPSFVVETTTVGENLSRTELQGRLRAFGLRLSPHGTHAQVRDSSGVTRLFHFLPAGPGFDLGVASWPDAQLDQPGSVLSLVRERVLPVQLCDAQRSYDLWRAIAYSRVPELSNRLWNECDGPAVEAYVADCKLDLGRFGVCQEAEKLMLGLSTGRPELRSDIVGIVAATCDDYSCYSVATTLPFATAEECAQIQKACPGCVGKAKCTAPAER